MAPMQTQSSNHIDPIRIENFFEAIDFPTEEELLAALDASLKQSPWLPRPSSPALDVTSRNLARHWQEIGDIHSASANPKEDDHYLASLMEDPVSHQEVPVEPDFLAGLAKFLTDRLFIRMKEIYQAQHLLMDELAKIKS
jgi:hypothetical protein